MKKRSVVRTLAVGTLAGALLSTTAAWSHIRVDSPVARSTVHNQQKANPCGGVDKGEVTEVEAGSTITIEFAETVDHGGYYVVSFDPDGDDFDGDGDGEGDHPPTSSGDGGNGDGSLVLLDNIPDQDSSDSPKMYSVEVTLPSEPCDNCTLQLMQMMAQRNLGRSGTGHMYFRCMDMRLTAPAAPVEPVTPEPMTPEPVTPEPVTPEPVMPEPVMPEDAGAPVEPPPVAPVEPPPAVVPPAEPVTPEPQPVEPPPALVPPPEAPTMDLPPAAGVPAVPEADPGMAPGAALPVVDPAAALSPQPEDPSLASPAAEEGTGCSVVPSSGNSLWAAALALALGGLLRRRRKS